MTLEHFWAEESEAEQNKNISSVNFICAGIVLKYILLKLIIMIKSHWQSKTIMISLVLEFLYPYLFIISNILTFMVTTPIIPNLYAFMYEKIKNGFRYKKWKCITWKITTVKRYRDLSSDSNARDFSSLSGERKIVTFFQLSPR